MDQKQPNPEREQKNEENQADLASSEYKNSRKSKFENMGIDVAGAIRHNRAKKEKPTQQKTGNIVSFKELLAEDPINNTPLDNTHAHVALFHHHLMSLVPKHSITQKDIESRFVNMPELEGRAAHHANTHLKWLHNTIKDSVNKASEANITDHKDSIKNIAKSLSDKVLEYYNTQNQTAKSKPTNDDQLLRGEKTAQLLALDPLRKFYNKAFAKAGAPKLYLNSLSEYTGSEHAFADHVSNIISNNAGKQKSTTTKLKDIKRIGEEHNLKTPEDFQKFLMDEAKLKCVQYGNSVSDSEREHHLSHLSSSLKDLASILQIPQSMLSMNNRLGISIGARGKTTAMAHYEPTHKVINLTKTKGSGTLSHEWGHAFDHHLGSIVGGYNSGWATHSAFHLVGKHETSQHMGNLSAVLEDFALRIHNDHTSGEVKNRNIQYLLNPQEIFARAFEGYIHHKLMKSGKQNNYLVDHDKVDKNAIYPNVDERSKMEPLFDALFHSFRNSDLLHKSAKLLAPMFFSEPRASTALEQLRKSTNSPTQPQNSTSRSGIQQPGDSMAVASIAVIYHNHLLMGQRRDNKKWTLPGGQLDIGETPDEAAHRELAEEAGITTTESKPLHHLASAEVFAGSDPQRPITVHSYVFFGYAPTDSSKDPDKEVEKWVWVDISSEKLPTSILSNLHSPKNVTLRALGLQDWK